VNLFDIDHSAKRKLARLSADQSRNSTAIRSYALQCAQGWAFPGPA
jgi:hypothetical protein